jgi:putative FmdB family regulatory protein
MPTYEYECKSCSHCFEVFQSMSDSPVKECPECGNEVRRLIFGGAGVIFKGSGFYVTDKGKANSSQKTESCASCANVEKCDSAPKQSSAGGESTKSSEGKSESKSA